MDTIDIIEHTLSALCIKKVYLFGKRGPVQAACIAKEYAQGLVQRIKVCRSSDVIAQGGR